MKMQGVFLAGLICLGVASTSLGMKFGQQIRDISTNEKHTNLTKGKAGNHMAPVLGVATGTADSRFAVAVVSRQANSLAAQGTAASSTSGGIAPVRYASNSGLDFPDLYPVSCVDYYGNCEATWQLRKLPETGSTGYCNNSSECIVTTADYATVSGTSNPSGWTSDDPDDDCSFVVSGPASGWTEWRRFRRQVKYLWDPNTYTCDTNTRFFDIEAEISGDADIVYGCRATGSSCDVVSYDARTGEQRVLKSTPIRSKSSK